MTLSLDEGPTLLGSRKRQHYYGPGPGPSGREVEGSPVFSRLIHGENLHDVAVRGKSTINGSASAFRDRKRKRTKCIYLVNCRNVLERSDLSNVRKPAAISSEAPKGALSQNDRRSGSPK